MSVALFAYLVLATARPVLSIMVAWVVTVMQASVAGFVAALDPGTASAVRLIDEPMLLTLFGVLLLKRLLLRPTPEMSLRPVAPALGIFLAGAASTFVVGSRGAATFLGIWYDLKFWLILAIVLMAPLTLTDLERCYRLFHRVGLIVAVSGLLDFIDPHDFRALVHTGSLHTSALRGGSVQGFFVNPGEFSTFMSLMFAITIAHYMFYRRRTDILSALLFLVLSALSLRLKSVLSPLVVVAVLAVATHRPARKGLGGVLGWMALAGVVLLPVYGQIIAIQGSKYTLSAASGTPRGMLYSSGWLLAKDHFPLGTGFGTFGEDAARKYYSPLYQSLGWSDIHGLSPKFSQYLTDTSWPAVYTENGLPGALIYVVGIALLLVRCRRAARSPDGALAAAGVLSLATLASYLTLSLGSPMLFNSPQTLLPLALVAIAIGRPARQSPTPAYAATPGALRAASSRTHETSRP